MIYILKLQNMYESYLYLIQILYRNYDYTETFITNLQDKTL